MCSIATALQAADPGSDPASRVDDSLTFEARLTAMDATVRLDPERGRMEAQVKVTVDAPGATRLQFSLHPEMVVESVRGSVYTELHRNTDAFTIELDGPLRKAERFTLQLAGRPSRNGNPAITPQGCWWAPHEAWLPVFEEEWAQRRIRLEAPESWSMVATGRPENPSLRSWSTRQPTRSQTFAAGPQLNAKAYEIKGIPSLLIVSSGTTDQTVEVQEAWNPAMHWLASSLGPYPFEHWTVARLDGLNVPIQASGLLLLPKETEIDSASDAAFLLAGQWFGERIAGEGLYLQGFAAWQALAFSRDRKLAPPKFLMDARERYQNFDSTQDLPIRRLTPKDDPTVAIAKGSQLPDLLMEEVGSRRFNHAWQKMIRGPIGPRLSATEFRSAFERLTGRSVERVFRDWLDHRRLPALRSTLRTKPIENGQWRVDLTLVQSTGPFRLSVEVELHGAAKTLRETLKLQEDKTSLYWILPFEPKRLEIDPQGKIFWSEDTELTTLATQP